MCTDWDEGGESVTVEAPGYPPPGHPAEPDLFARHAEVPGHDQAAIARSHVLIVGAGGLGGWAALALARVGVRQLTIVDPDRFDRTNAPRQLMFPGDLGRPKALRLAHNIAAHMVAGGTIRAHELAFDLSFDESFDGEMAGVSLILGLVDNNRCRLDVSRVARRRRVPAVFTMLSLDGERMHSFLQSPHREHACLWCALPNLDPDGAAPCAAATIVSCLAAASATAAFAIRALTPTPSVWIQNWREGHVSGVFGRVGQVARRPGCPGCGQVEE